MRTFSDLEIQEICNMYVNNKESISQIARLKNSYPARIRKILVDNNITILKNPRTKNKFLREDYFEKIDTEEKAYFLGLLFTDGCIRLSHDGRQNQVRLELQLQDKYMLEKLKEELCSDSKLTFTKKKNKSGTFSESAILSIRSNKIVQDLKKYGIIEKKTYLTKHLPNIPEPFQKDFLRGLIDGDGSIYFTSCFNKEKQVYYDKKVIYFCDYSKSVCEDFRKMCLPFLSRDCCPFPKKEGQKELYRITFTKQSDVKELTTALYKDNKVCLTRKYELAKRIFEYN